MRALSGGQDGKRGYLDKAPVFSYIVAKEEMIIEEAEGAEHSQNSGEGSLYWHGVKEGIMQIFSLFVLIELFQSF